jgi:hypothetical protein
MNEKLQVCRTNWLGHLDSVEEDLITKKILNELCLVGEMWEDLECDGEISSNSSSNKTG